MGWFDMLKSDEVNAKDFVTDVQKQRTIDEMTAYTMDYSYPDWRTDVPAYTDQWNHIKNIITEGFQ